MTRSLYGTVLAAKAVVGVLLVFVAAPGFAASEADIDPHILSEMKRLDADGDGKITPTEAGQHWKRFKRHDTDGDDALSLAEFSQRKVPYLPTKGQRKLNVVYKTTPLGELRLDFYAPVDASRPSPVVIYTHGGGWAAGNRHGAGLGRMKQVLTALHEAGFAVAPVSYRLATKENGTGMRDCVIDAKDAIRYLAKNHEALGIDPQRFFVFGDSAGGHIAQMLLLSPPSSLTGDPDLAGVDYRAVAGVSWYGPCDFEDVQLFNHDDRPNFHNRFARRIAPGKATPQQLLKLSREMSPVRYLSADSPPLLMIQGDKDTTIPVKHAYRMQEEAQKLGAPVEISIVKNSGHNWRSVGAPTQPTSDQIIDQTIGFLVGHEQ